MEIVTMINEDKSICKNGCYNRDKKQQASINYNHGNSLNK